MTDIYSNTKPDLISNTIKKSMFTITQKNADLTTMTSTLIGGLKKIYNDHLHDNRYTFIFIFVVLFFLLYRYFNRDTKSTKREKNKKEKEAIKQLEILAEAVERDEESRDKENRDMSNKNNINNNYTTHLDPNFENQYSPRLTQQFNDFVSPPDTMYNGYLRPNFKHIYDPDYATAQQPVIYHQAPSSYPRAPPVNHAGGVNFVNNYSGDFYKRYSGDMNNVSGMSDINNNYVNNAAYNNYNGVLNDYVNAQDPINPNQVGYPVNFNTSTGDFVGKMTEANSKNIADYNAILSKTNEDLLGRNNSKIPSVIPPYSDL